MALMWVVDIVIVAVMLAMVNIFFSSILRIVMVTARLFVVALVVIRFVFMAWIIIVRIDGGECRCEN